MLLLPVQNQNFSEGKAFSELLQLILIGFFSSSRERHAKTIEIAQNEVVTCLGLYMYDRLHRMQTALKSVEQTFHLMYYTGVIALYNNFQVSFYHSFPLD